MSDLKVEIVTPFGMTYMAEVTSCTLPGAAGQFQVLKNHAALLSLIDIGIIKIEESGGEKRYLATSGGFCEIEKNEVRIIVESAELAEKIDAARAKDALERAEKRLESKKENVDTDRAKLALARAFNRLKATELR